MAGRKRGYAWVQGPATPKFDARRKDIILNIVNEAVKTQTKLSKMVIRVAIRGHRVYLYQLYEPYQDENTVFTIPLIDGKYFEIPYARLTLRDTNGDKCELDWQRHNDQWMTLHSGTLKECLEAIETSEWFDG
jgi:hypothetical protein